MSALLDFWHGMIVHLWQTTLILLVLLLLERGLSKAPAKVSHVLWSIGLIKLFLPLSFFGSLTNTVAGKIIGTSLIEQYRVITDLPVVSIVVNPLGNSTFGNSTIELSMIWIATGITALWGTCMVYLFYHTARDLVQSHRHGGHSISILDNHTREKLCRVIAVTGIPTTSVLCTNRHSMPLVTGLFMPKILISDRLVKYLSEMELEAILLHEEMHRRRFDPLRTVIARICRAIFFFYPLLYLVLRRLRSTVELACDEGVVQSGVSAGAYSQALIKTLRLGLALPAYSSAAALANRSQLHRRLKHLSTLTVGRFTMSLKYRLVILIAVLAVVTGTFYPLPMHAEREEKLSYSSSSDSAQTDDEVVFPKAIKTYYPEYPEQAKKLGLSAGVKLKVVVDENGRVAKVKTVEAYIKFTSDKEDEKEKLSKEKQEELAKLFTDAAATAAKKWQFEPGSRNGKPVKMEVMLPVEFKLE